MPSISVTNDRISAAHKNIREVPFEFKRRFCNTFGMDVADVKVMFQNPWSLELFSRIVWTLQIDPSIAFQWIYKTIYEHAVEVDADFRNVVLHQFGPKKLIDLLTLINESLISTENGRTITKLITQGDERMPSQIAEDKGFTGEVQISEDLKEAVADVMKNNPEIVEQIWLTNKASPVMALVKKVTE